MPLFPHAPNAFDLVKSLSARNSQTRLAVTAAMMVGAFMFNSSLPAEAAPEQAPAQQIETVQELEVEAASVPAPTQRDDYGVTKFALVKWPVPAGSKISSGFGGRSAPCAGCSTNHDGVDFTPGAGTPVAALADGVVTEVGNPSGGLGVYAMIEHVIDGARYTSVYGHMQLGSLSVAVGQQVTAGQQLGRVGSTGQSTGPHLHLELWDAADGRLDPLTFLRSKVNA
ncbi:M23 family metallopeptidase [Ruicaihuangia caeni]|uniref:M23 family metallopeptidase n=1 Tax=Ruicaihuangia caeni TaxID=3042517 RepID=A0AAW6T9D0_9MICO|nr:M23 family metallopeptidase [Klugiella sp. YN-L-19]MDI2097757.1 M23 family metallopeptidase [Klugiella sp. YN-L-19]